MFKQDEIIKSLEYILSSSDLNNFDMDGYFQINGITQECSIQQHQFKKSIFSFDNYNTSILHFTNLNSLKLILQSSFLLASRFNDFEDKNELLHGFKLADIQEFDFQEIKKYLFASSFTPYVKNEDYSKHWEIYGNHGKGVALEFELSNNPLHFQHFITKVVYVNQKDKLDFINRIKEKFKYSEALKALAPILGSIKEPSFKEEKEVRIIYYPRKDEAIRIMDSELQGYTLDKDNNASFFGKLPIQYPNEDRKDHQLLVLRKIHFGKSTFDNDGIHMIDSVLKDQIISREIQLSKDLA